jgi:myo-inositol-hexaphosphate 3-phosphohydrolase
MKRVIKFTPVVVLKNGILYMDGNMLYTDARGKWLYVSEDGQTVLLYTNIGDLIRDMYRRNSDDDYVITGWDSSPTRFDSYIDSAYQYYNERFEN